MGCKVMMEPAGKHGLRRTALTGGELGILVRTFEQLKDVDRS
jgi:hypothetical protein